MVRGISRTFAAGDATPARAGRFPIGGWMRWIAGARTVAREPAETSAPSVSASVSRLPTLLDGSSLPNGVVELVVEDFDAPTRELFDVHDGVIAPIEPGSAVPWTSIAGPPAAWASALGPEHLVEGLRLTGDEALARRVIAAFPACV